MVNDLFKCRADFCCSIITSLLDLDATSSLNIPQLFHSRRATEISLPLDMEFFKLPLELRRMIYKETCPVTLHFPIRVQTDMPLAATSHQARSEYLLEVVRIPTSFILHLQTDHTIDEFLDWFHPRTARTLPHLTRLVVKTPSLTLGLVALCKIRDFLEIHDTTGQLLYCVVISTTCPKLL